MEPNEGRRRLLDLEPSGEEQLDSRGDWDWSRAEEQSWLEQTTGAVVNREKEGLRWLLEAAAAAAAAVVAVVAEGETVAEDMVEERSGRGLRLFYVPKCQQ